MEQIKKIEVNIAKSLGLIFVNFLTVMQVAFGDGRSLDQAANNAVSIATNLGRAISVLGILIAAIAYNIPGLSSSARKILTGSLAGAACAFGGPAVIKVIQSIF